MTKRYLLISFLASMLLPAIPLVAQSAPDIRFDSVADPLKFPDNIHLGEVAGVATDSKGNIFVYANGSSDDHDRHFAGLRSRRFPAV